MKMGISVEVLLFVIFCGIVHGASSSIELESELRGGRPLKSYDDWMKCRKSCLGKNNAALAFPSDQVQVKCLKECCPVQYTPSSRDTSHSRLISHQDLMSSVRGSDEEGNEYPLMTIWGECVTSYTDMLQGISVCCNKPPLAN